MKQIVLALLAALFVACGATSASATTPPQLSDIQISSLAVQVVDAEGGFNVIDSRMDETATAGVFFGLVGATVNSAINNSEDAAKAAPLRPAADHLDLVTLIGDAIRTRLAARPVVPLADTPAAASHTLIVDIGDWGLVRRAQHPDTYLRTFLKLDVRIVDARGRTVWRSQREHFIGQLNAELSAFTPEVFTTEMQTLAASAGQQLANRIIYR